MKRLFIFLLILSVGMCTGCSKLTEKNEESEGAIDYEKAYADYTDTFLELNDISRIQIDENCYQTILYYKDVKGNLVPVMRQIPKREGIAKSILSALIDDEDNRIELRETGLSPVLPEGTEFELALKDDNLVRISLNDAIMSFEDQRDEVAAVQSIVYTLTEFDNIDKVQILLNDNVVETLTHGTEVKDPLTRSNINTVDNIVSGEYVKKTFYSYNNTSNNYTYFYPITKNISSDNVDIENVFREQMNILQETNVEIPEGFEVSSIQLRDQTSIILVDGEVDTTKREYENLIKSISLMLGENFGVTTVRLTVGDEIDEHQVPVYANVYE